MSRKDYDVIKDNFGKYIKSWKTRDVKSLENIVDPLVHFNTSSSKTMTNGGQDSIFGVYDFINDFPLTDILHLKIYNYVCRVNGDEAYMYASVPCTAFNHKESIEFLEFTVMVMCRWIKMNDCWIIQAMRQEIVGERGTLFDHFEKNWHFENESGNRIAILRGEGDSPWINVRQSEDVLTEVEKVKECIIKNCFGQEWNSFYHCYEAYSDSYHTYTHRKPSGDRKKDHISIMKHERNNERYSLSPMKFMNIEIDENRAFVQADRVRGLRQNSREYEYTVDNVNIEHTCSRCEFELVKEGSEWKIAYQNSFKGIYEIGEYNENELYGDLC